MRSIPWVARVKWIMSGWDGGLNIPKLSTNGHVEPYPQAEGGVDKLFNCRMESRKKAVDNGLTGGTMRAFAKTTPPKSRNIVTAKLAVVGK